MEPTTRWQLDPAHSPLEFAVRHLMIATVKGRFTDLQGTVTMTGEDPATAAVEVTIAAPSLTTGVAQRDEHLRSADFLDVARFPVLRFESRKVEPVGDETFRLTGDLTIKNQTREVSLTVTREGAARDPWGGYRIGFRASVAIRRSDFGITWNQILEAGGVAVADEVRVSIETELVQEPVRVAA